MLIYLKSMFHLFFKARLALIEHDVKSASEHYEKYLQITTIDFKQMGNLYLWELMWCHAYVAI